MNDDFWSPTKTGVTIGHMKRLRKGLSTSLPTIGTTNCGGGGGGRYVKWNPGQQYTCLRPGQSMLTTALIDDMFKNNSLTEEMFFIFKNVDPNAARSEHVPLYEAAYQLTDGRYFIVKKSHMKQAYANSNRTDLEKMWCIAGDALPYAVDRHAFSRKKQVESKCRYQNKRGKTQQ